MRGENCRDTLNCHRRFCCKHDRSYHAFLFWKLILDASQGTLPFAIGLIAIAIALNCPHFSAGGYFARKAYILQQEVAGKEPKTRLWIDRSALIPEDLLGIKEVVFGYSVEEGASVFCVIPFIVDNNGDVDAKDVHVNVIMTANVSAHGLTKIDAQEMLLFGRAMA